MTVGPGPASKASKAAEEELRSFALRFPLTREDHPWGHSAFKVKDKVFLFLGLDEKGLSLSVKLPESRFDALELPFCEPTHYGMGKHGWVTAAFGPHARPPLDMIKAWVTESFRAIAPKKVVAELDGAPPAAKKAKPKARKVAKPKRK
jgi:predicted DNA-binding protein (MmcQ/YjbR family)